MANKVPSGPMLFSLLATRPPRKTFENVTDASIHYYDGASEGAEAEANNGKPLENTSSSVFMTQCISGTEFTFRRLTNLVLERCKGVTVHVDSVIASCELISCEDVTLIVHRRAGTLTLDACNKVKLAFRQDVTAEEIADMTSSPFTIYSTRPSCTDVSLELPDPTTGNPQCIAIIAAGEEEEGLPPCRWATTWTQGIVESLPCNSYGDTAKDMEPKSKTGNDAPAH